MTRHFSHTAMATRFEMWLCGDDDQLQAVAFQAWAEVDRLELMMSRHDPRAELARVNREAHERPVRVEVELFNVLHDCLAWLAFTDGYFDIAYRSRPAARTVEPPSNYVLDRDARTVHFAHAGVELDLGGYGKGYALDRIGDMLKPYGITSAFIQGGTSSALALGTQEDGRPWVIDIPHYSDPEQVLLSQALHDQGFSYSATVSAGDDPLADIVNPHENSLITDRAACWVVSPNALQAEVLTTTFLAMGKEKADRFFEERVDQALKVGWI